MSLQFKFQWKACYNFSCIHFHSCFYSGEGHRCIRPKTCPSNLRQLVLLAPR